MEFFRIKRDIPFMSYGRLTTFISLATFIIAVILLAVKGLNYSVEFTGGTVLKVHYQQSADLNKIRGKINTLNLGEIAIQNFGTTQDVMIRIPSHEGAHSNKVVENVMNALKADDSTVKQTEVEFIGPQVGEELVTHGLAAIAMVCIGIIFYLSVRFEWRFALSAIIANMHDIVIILGFFALFQWDFSLTVLAGILAVLGYSVNESVVVFDRIRENFRKGSMRKKSVPEVIDNAITSTMSRTIITHASTEMVVLSMLFVGGPTLHGFAIALTIGIVFGVYSSVLVASPLLLLFGVNRENLAKTTRKKEEAVV